MTTSAGGMRALITGGSGFLGTLLARRILETGVLEIAGQTAPLAELVLLDLTAPHDPVAAQPHVRVATGELTDQLGTLGAVDVIFHLAGVVSGAAEADFDLGMRTNVDGTRAVLEYARALPGAPTVVFASSLAVFGSDPAIGPIGTVTDDTLPRPQSSYGTQKFIGEQLVADYSRKGFLDGRSVRLMTVSVRPGAPNAAASSFLSGIIREPLAGLRAECPVPPNTEIALSSPARTIDAILRTAATDAAAWGSRTAMNLPALTTTPAAMVEAMDRVTGGHASDLVSWTSDPAIGAIVESWPARFETARANRLGLRAPESFDEIVREYLASTAVAARVHP